MSADSPKLHHAPRQIKGDPHIVTPQEVTDPSILESVAGFINDVVPTSYTTPFDITDQIQWAHFEQLDLDQLNSFSDCEKNAPSPIILVLGYSTGIQVWCVTANGEATEIISWRHGSTKVLRILPSPYKVEGDCKDVFLAQRPLMALCDSSSPGPPYCSLSFLSLKTGEQVKLIKFKTQILDVRANKKSVVVTFSEKIAVFDAFTLEDRCTVTTCYLSPGIQPNPIALGSRWLAYADKTLTSSRKSSAGCDSEGVQSYKATVIQCAKSLGKGIKEFSESVANSLTGSSNFKPGVVCPGSPQSGGPANGCQKGVVTILDVENNQINSGEKTIPTEAVIAHFIAHNEAIVSLEFDSSGMLLLTADRKGHDFHVFRINPHPVGSFLASVHHLYILHRGDTTAKVQDMCFSPDSRWCTVSTLRGTTHVFPITSYGGHVGVRTHTTQHVVNRMSRFHRSAGLTGEQRSNSPVSGLEATPGNFYPYTNPRFPPYPHPTIIHPLAQIRQPVSIQATVPAQARTTNSRTRLSSSSEESISLRVVACFASPRAYMDTSTPQESTLKKVKAIESLFVMGCHGSLIQYDLEPHPMPNVPKEKLCDDTPIELRTDPKAQWVLQRPSNATDVTLPLCKKYIQYLLPTEPMKKKSSFEESDDHWLSQVEIVTHAGPHRRLWMGPQFTFKTYTTATGCPFSLTNVQQLDIGRSKPVNMPVTQNAVFIECGSANSRELSPPMNTYHTTFDEISGPGELQLKEDLADAMLESPGIRETGGRCVIVSMKPQASPVAKVVNPLGTVVTIQSDEEELEKEHCEDVVIHENCDEALFRPIVAPKPILYSTGKPRTNPTDTMIVRNLDNTTGMAVKILDKSKTNNTTTNKTIKHIFDKTQDLIQSKMSNITISKKKEQSKIKQKETSDSPNISYDIVPEKTKDDELLFPEPPPLDTIDCGSIFQETRDDLKDGFDFHYLETNNEVELKTETFEDATDCYDDLIYINQVKGYFGKKDEEASEEKLRPNRPRKPKTKLGVRIPNRTFQTENEDDATMDVFESRYSWDYPPTRIIEKEEFRMINDDEKSEIKNEVVNNAWVKRNEEKIRKNEENSTINNDYGAPRRTWSSVAALKPKERWEEGDEWTINDIDYCDDRSTINRSHNASNVKNVRLIHIETPADEDAAIEIIEPILPVYRKSNRYAKFSDDDKLLVDASPGETTESDDSGKLPENNVAEDFSSSQSVVQTVNKAAKKKSKKKRK